MWGASRLGFWFLYDPIQISWNLNQTNILPECGPGGWYLANQGKQIRFIVQNSVEPDCGGCNPFVQSGTAVASLEVAPGNGLFFGYSLLGKGEAQDTGYERMSLYLNGVGFDNQLLCFATSPGGNKGCAPGEDVIQTTVTPGPLYLFPNSTYTFTLDFTTQDMLYHTDCYYQCDLGFYNP